MANDGNDVSDGDASPAPRAPSFLEVSAIFILLAVGALIETWNMAGTIPTVVDYGVRLLNPAIFYLTTAVICGSSAWSRAARGAPPAPSASPSSRWRR